MLLKSSYLRAIATLSSAQILAAIIPFLAAPVLGRIYNPEDYGLLASFIAIVVVSASVVTMNYHHGVVIEKTDRRAHQVAFLSLAAVTGVAILMVPIAIGIFFLDPFGSAAPDHQFWYLLLPISTFVVGISLTAMAVANRAQAYRTIAAIQFLTATASVLASVAFGLAGMRSSGLFLGYLSSQAVTLAFSVAILIRHEVLKHRSPMRQIRRLTVRHRGFPLFTTPSSFIRAQAEKSPEFMLMRLGASDALGSYSRAIQLISMPVFMITTSVSRVYFRTASEEFIRDGNCMGRFWKTSFSMLLIGALPFMVIWLFAEQLFTFYLGPNWSMAGVIARILAPMLYLQFALQPVNSVFQFAGKQRYGLALNVAYLVSVMGGVWIAFMIDDNSLSVIKGFSTGTSVAILLQFVFAAKHSRG